MDSPAGFKGTWSCWHVDFGHLASRTMRLNFYCFKPLVFDTFKGISLKWIYILLKLLKTVLNDEMIWGFHSIFIPPWVSWVLLFLGIPGRNLKPCLVDLRPVDHEPFSGIWNHLSHPHGLTFSLLQKLPSFRWLGTKQAACVLIPFFKFSGFWYWFIWWHLLMSSITK